MFPKTSDGYLALNVKVSLIYHPSLPCWDLADTLSFSAIACYCKGRGISFVKNWPDLNSESLNDFQ